jgi:hypothetical protein
MNRHECALLLTAGVMLAACRGQVALSSEPGNDAASGSSSGSTISDDGGQTASGSGDANSLGSSGQGSGAQPDAPGASSDEAPDAAGDLKQILPPDATADVEVPPAPSGLAGFSLIVDDVVQKPIACPHTNWVYLGPATIPEGPACTSQPTYLIQGGSTTTICYSVASEIIANSGNVPLAYTALAFYGDESGPFPPGVDFGDPSELSGVLAPGAEINIASSFVGNFGVVAELGASEPFSEADAGRYVTDEGTIPWPEGVPGSQGSAVMYVAQIDFDSACPNMVTPIW